MHRLLLGAARPAASETSEMLAHAFVGAGESVANWWLEHPEEPREDVAKLLVRLLSGSLPELDSPPRSEARS